MGLDGGTIPSRTDLLRRASWRLANSKKGNARSTRGGTINADNFRSEEESIDKVAQAALRLATCALTGDPLDLSHPIYACELGMLYNRQSLVDFFASKGLFVDKTDYMSQFSHLRSLKRMIRVHFTPNSGAVPERKSDAPLLLMPPSDLSSSSSISSSSFSSASSSSSAATSSSSSSSSSHQRSSYSHSSSLPPPLFLCPVTDLPSNGKHPFVVLAKCGHAFSEKAMAVAGSSQCFVCSEPYSKSDILPIWSSDEVRQALRERIEKRRERKRQRKEEKGQGVLMLMPPESDTIDPESATSSSVSTSLSESSASSSPSTSSAAATTASTTRLSSSSSPSSSLSSSSSSSSLPTTSPSLSSSSLARSSQSSKKPSSKPKAKTLHSSKPSAKDVLSRKANDPFTFISVSSNANTKSNKRKAPSSSFITSSSSSSKAQMTPAQLALIQQAKKIEEQVGQRKWWAL